MFSYNKIQNLNELELSTILEDTIRSREEIHEQIDALEELKEMAENILVEIKTGPPYVYG